MRDRTPRAPKLDWPGGIVPEWAKTPEGARNIVGIQGNLWSETLGADGRLEDMLLPKLFGLAERAWAPEPDWSLERAAGVMVERGFRHLVVVEGGEIAGVLSVRDIVRMWTKEGAHCEVPAGASAA